MGLHTWMSRRLKDPEEAPCTRDTSSTAETPCSDTRAALSLCSLGLWVAGELTELTLSSDLINLMNLTDLMKQSAHRTSDRLACLLCLHQLIVESRIEGIADFHRPLGPKFTDHQRLAYEGNSTALQRSCCNSCNSA